MRRRRRLWMWLVSQVFPSNTYITEDASQAYITEDGLSPYVTEA